MEKTETKDLNYYKNNCEEDYIKTPISVLRYISELEEAINYTHSCTELVCTYCGINPLNETCQNPKKCSSKKKIKEL